MTRLHLFLILVGLLVTSAAEAQVAGLELTYTDDCVDQNETTVLPWQCHADVLEDLVLTLRPTIEGHRKVYLDSTGYPKSSARFVMAVGSRGHRKVYLDPTGHDNFALLHGRGLFPLRASEPVHIARVNVDRNSLELHLRSNRLGSGRIAIHGKSPSAPVFEAWLDQLFEIKTPEHEFYRYIGNRSSRTLHVLGANHLPAEADREYFAALDDADEYHRCGVCFLTRPDVIDYETERSLAMFSLQYVQSTFNPYPSNDYQDYIDSLGQRVLNNWPVPLKGYRYRFQVVDSDDINAFAVPTGYIYMTSGLLSALETDEEVEAVLAHEIAHVESRHSYRMWRNQQTAGTIIQIVGLLAGSSDEDVSNLVDAMSSFVSSLYLSGYGRNREREADMFSSHYLSSTGIGQEPLINAFKKLKFARDAQDPFGDGGGGLFASHPDIDERLQRAAITQVNPFAETEIFVGKTARGREVATLRFELQRLYLDELEVVVTLTTTAELGEQADLNRISIQVAGERVALRERTAEKIFPSDEVSAVYGNDEFGQFIQSPIESLDLQLRNVARWERLHPIE